MFPFREVIPIRIRSLSESSTASTSSTILFNPTLYSYPCYHLMNDARTFSGEKAGLFAFRIEPCIEVQPLVLLLSQRSKELPRITPGASSPVKPRYHAARVACAQDRNNISDESFLRFPQAPTRRGFPLCRNRSDLPFRRRILLFVFRSFRGCPLLKMEKQLLLQVYLCRNFPFVCLLPTSNFW